MKIKKQEWVLPVKLVCSLPAIFGFIIIVISSFLMVFVKRHYESKQAKVLSIGVAHQNHQGEFLVGKAITIEDSIPTKINLDNLIKLNFCKDLLEVKEFLIQYDSIIPIWKAPGTSVSRVRMGAAKEFNYFIEGYIDSLIFSTLLCIPFIIISLIEKRIEKQNQ